MRTVIGAVVVALGIFLGPAAAAHGGPGVIELITPAGGSPVERSSNGTVRVEIELTYEGDGDPVNTAAVTATASSPGQPPVPGVAMTAAGSGGRYSADLAIPTAGTWTIEFASGEPAEAVLRVEQVVTVATTTTTAAPTTTSPSTTSPSTTEPADAVVTTTSAPETTTASGDEGSSLWVGLVAVLGLGLIGGAAAFVARRRTP